MTGYIKPEEIHQTQEAVVELLNKTGERLDEQSDALQEFMRIHPVTKEKESGYFRKVNGVYVTEQAYREADSMQRPIERFL